MQNIQNISTKELRDNLSEILEKVAVGGQSFAVYKFGRKKALIAPADLKKSAKTSKKEINKMDFRKHPAYGMWKNRKDMKDSAKWVTDLRAKASNRINS